MFYTKDGDLRPHWGTRKSSHVIRSPYRISIGGHIEYSAIGRENQPRWISPDGCIHYTNVWGEYHRTDGPAIITANGTKEYMINDTPMCPDEFFLIYGVL